MFFALVLSFALSAPAPPTLVQTGSGVTLEWMYDDVDLTYQGSPVNFFVAFDGGAFLNVGRPVFSSISGGALYRSPGPSTVKTAKVMACATVLLASVCSAEVGTEVPQPPPPPKFVPGQPVRVYSGDACGQGAAVRSAPAVFGTNDPVHPAGTDGTVLEGPAVAPIGGTNFNWYRIDYANTTADGWTTECNLDAAPTPPPPPPPPPMHVSTITVKPTSTPPSGNIVVDWTCKAVCDVADRIALFSLATPGAFTEVPPAIPTNGAAAGTFTRAAPVTPGMYEWRYCATSLSACPTIAAFIVTQPPPPPPPPDPCKANPPTLKVTAWPTFGKATSAKYDPRSPRAGKRRVYFTFDGTRAISATLEELDGPCAGRSVTLVR